MKFFFADSQDLVDPSFDFDRESRSSERVRQRDDQYAHELFSSMAYDGLLVSKGCVDGLGEVGRYTIAQRQRLLRIGGKEFFRAGALPIMGDCGAFAYVREKTPPYTVDEVIEFYLACGFDYGISVDHVILAYQPQWDDPTKPAGQAAVELRDRQEITLKLAAEFLARHRTDGLPFIPLGVAQGWSPLSYATAVRALQDMGYEYIALGGMVPLKTRDILACLEAIHHIRHPKTKLHLLGITRIQSISAFARFGAVSFDSTSPLRQAFKDGKDNYYAMDRTYTAIRVPQVEGNPSLERRIKAGMIPQDRARRLEQACLNEMREFDSGRRDVEEVLAVLREYEALYDPGKDHSAVYRETLNDRPWKRCGCDVCAKLGHHVILFRGAERNRRRGFHNLWVFYRRLHRALGLLSNEKPISTNAKQLLV